VFPGDEISAPTPLFPLELPPSAGLQRPFLTHSHHADHAELPGSPPGGRSGQFHGEIRAAGGDDGGFEIPIALVRAGFATATTPRVAVREAFAEFSLLPLPFSVAFAVSATAA
jgi:hypothetical protein